MSKIVPNFSNFLQILKIVLELLLTTLGDIVSVSKAKNYSGLNLFHPEFENKYFTLFWLSFMSKIVPNFSKFFTDPQNRSRIAADTLGGHSECI